MILKAVVEDREFRLNIPESLLTRGADFFAQLDADMDQGWQMSREWVPHPSRLERCQIVADKLLSALEKENDRLGRLMAGYLLSRLPGLESVELDTHGEIQNTQFQVAGETLAPVAPPGPEAAFQVPPAPQGLSPEQAQEQAESDVTSVFKVGRGYRFSIFDHASGQWQNAPLMPREEDARRLRQATWEARCLSLQQPPP